MKNLKIDIVDKLTDLYAIKDAWLQLEESCTNMAVTSSYHNVTTWWKHFGSVDAPPYGAGKKPAVVCLYRQGEPIALAPFCLVKRKIKKYFNYTALEFIGQQWFGTYCDILGPAMAADVRDYFWRQVYKRLRFHVLSLRYVPAHSPHLYLVPGEEKGTMFAAGPVIDHMNYKAIAAGFSKNLKQNMRTAYNRMKKDGVSLEVRHIANPGPQIMEGMRRVSASKLADGKHSHYLDKKRDAFLRDYYDGNNLHLVGLFLDGNLAAYRLNVLYHNRKFCLDAAYDRRYKRYELGALSVAENIRDSCNRGLSAHHMGVGLDAYKLKFCKKVVLLYSFTDCGSALAGKLLYRKKQLAAQQNEHIFKETFRERLNHKPGKKKGKRD